MQINTQPTEGMDRTDEGFVLDYVGLWSTIQGEGPLVGMPATFVRLAGCTLLCPYCDTNYTTGRKKEHYNQLVQKCCDLPARLVVITGGEPFRQPIFKFIRGLIDNRFKVQIETNGTVLHQAFSTEERLAMRRLIVEQKLHIVCSPKTPKVHPVLAHYVTAVKYIGKSGSICSEDGLPLKSLEHPAEGKPARPKSFPMVTKDQIYLQPLDEQDEVLNKRNIQACVDSCLKYGWRMSLQVHKILGLP